MYDDHDISIVMAVMASFFFPNHLWILRMGVTVFSGHWAKEDYILEAGRTGGRDTKKYRAAREGQRYGLVHQ